MSVQSEITRLSNARDNIRTKLVELGVATGTDKLDDLATAINKIENKGAISATVVEGQTYTIPKGYHNGSGTVSGLSDIAGDAESYKKQAKTVTPTKSQINVTPDAGYYALDSVTINPIPDEYQNVSSVTATADTVLTGKTFVASDGNTVAGTMPNNGVKTVSLNTTTTEYNFEGDGGYFAKGSKVSINLEEKTVTPTTTSQPITPSTGKVLSKVTVNPIPTTFINTSSATITSDTVLKDKVAYGIANGVATEIIGTMPNNGQITGYMTGLTDETSSYTIPAGYTSGGTVSLTYDIENNLKLL